MIDRKIADQSSIRLLEPASPARKSVGSASRSWAKQQLRRPARRQARSSPGRVAARLDEGTSTIDHDFPVYRLDLFGLREDVLARDLVDELRMVGAQMHLRLLP